MAFDKIGNLSHEKAGWGGGEGGRGGGFLQHKEDKCAGHSVELETYLISRLINTTSFEDLLQRDHLIRLDLFENGISGRVLVSKYNVDF